jgi:hypothetical protein
MGTTSRVCQSCDTPLPVEAKFCLNCGAATPTLAGEPPSTIAPTEAQFERLKEALADRYLIERVLGSGGTRRNARRNSDIRQLRSNVGNLRYG